MNFNLIHVGITIFSYQKQHGRNCASFKRTMPHDLWLLTFSSSSPIGYGWPPEFRKWFRFHWYLRQKSLNVSVRGINYFTDMVSVAYLILRAMFKRCVIYQRTWCLRSHWLLIPQTQCQRSHWYHGQDVRGVTDTTDTMSAESLIPWTRSLWSHRYQGHEVCGVIDTADTAADMKIP
jgi:hypothetical protein